MHVSICEAYTIEFVSYLAMYPWMLNGIATVVRANMSENIWLNKSYILKAGLSCTILSLLYIREYIYMSRPDKMYGFINCYSYIIDYTYLYNLWLYIITELYIYM